MIKIIYRQMQVICLPTLLASTVLVGCKKSTSDLLPLADYSYSGNTMASATITFTNKSTNAVSYAWDFGDNGTSTLPSPTHTFSKGGVYTVTLKSTGNGGTNTITKTINISSPTSVKVTQVRVIELPLTTSTGGGWDNNSGPDVSFTITDVNNNVLYNHPNYFSNVISSNLPLTFSLSSPFQVTNFNTTYKVMVWDYDGDDFPPNPDDYMGGYQFSFSGFTQDGYPTTGILYLPGSDIKIQLTLQWQ